MQHDIVTCIEIEFPWKLTVGNFTASFSDLNGAEKVGREMGTKKEGFTIEHVIETRNYFPR